MPLIPFRRRSLSRLLTLFTCIFLIRFFFFPSSSSSSQSSQSSSSSSHFSSPTRRSASNNNNPTGPTYSTEPIQPHGFIHRHTGGGDRSLNVQKHGFLQARIGRDDEEGLMGDIIQNGARDYWERFQEPYITSPETTNTDAQHVISSIDQLLSLHGWVAALCPSLSRPFSSPSSPFSSSSHPSKKYASLASEDHLYFIALTIHSADHFLIDQLAVIVQLSKTLGTQNVYVSMLDYHSSDSTSTLLDLCEAVLTLLSIPFRIRTVPSLTHTEEAAYYPLEEAYTRNLVLEPLLELDQKRGIKFNRVIWLKGFTCPNDILENLKVSFANSAAMVCGMDWAENEGAFEFSDRWRTRDIEGDQFRQTSSKSDVVPPRDHRAIQRYTKHIPFQVFCCEAGTHVVDPEQSYYKGIYYRAGQDFFNVSRSMEGGGHGVKERGMGMGMGEQDMGWEPTPPIREPNAPCLDSSQAWFCRDLWVRSGADSPVREREREAVVDRIRRREVVDVASNDPLMDGVLRKREEEKAQEEKEKEKEKEKVLLVEKGKRQGEVKGVDLDDDAGSDYDAMPAEDGGDEVPLPIDASEGGSTSYQSTRPNSAFEPARILVNPRCVTTYAGVSHTQLALDLFGDPEEDDNKGKGVRKYVLEDWASAPESFVCQEQRTTGGRQATKTQRRLGFNIDEELRKLGIHK